MLPRREECEYASNNSYHFDRPMVIRVIRACGRLAYTSTIGNSVGCLDLRFCSKTQKGLVWRQLFSCPLELDILGSNEQHQKGYDRVGTGSTRSRLR